MKPTEQEIDNQQIKYCVENNHKFIGKAFVDGAQWAISQMQPEPTKHLTEMIDDDFIYIFGDNWAHGYIRKKVESFTSLHGFHYLLGVIGDFKSYSKAKELGYDVEFSLPQPPTK